MKQTVLLAACLAVSTLPGCVNLVSSSKHESITGAYVEPQDTRKIMIGRTTPDEAAQILGQPTTRVPNDDGAEVWTWKWTKHRSNSGELLLIAHNSKEVTVNEAFHILFRDGVASKKWRD